MKLQVYKNIVTCILVLFMSITTANAELITFRYEGVITEVGPRLRRVGYDLDAENNYANVFGYAPGDTFSGEYTFESESPNENNTSLDSFYPNVISGMSFVSGRNNLSATNGNIGTSQMRVLCSGECTEYDVFFPTVSAISGTVGFDNFNPVSMELLWFMTFNGIGLENLENGPPIIPFFDTSKSQFFSSTVGFVPPVYGEMKLTYSSDETDLTPSIEGVLYSVEVVPPIESNDDLVAHWPLNDGSGTTASDRSGNSHNGMLTNGPAWVNKGGNSKLLFDGNNDYVNLGSLDVPGNALTLAGKVESQKLENCNARDCRIISKAVGTAEQDHYWMLSTIKVGNKTRLRFRLKTNGSTRTLIASSGDLTKGIPFHVAATYDGNTMRLYKDGQEVGNLPKTGNIDNNSSAQTWIGSNPNVADSRPWKGMISDVRIYKKALTVAEVDAISH
jgi:hypothetical protein